MNVNECPETSYERRCSAGDNPRTRQKKKKPVTKKKSERGKVAPGKRDTIRAVSLDQSPVAQ